MNKTEFLRIADKISSGTASEEDIAHYNFYYNHFQDQNAEDGLQDVEEKENIDRELRSRIGLGLSGYDAVKPRSLYSWLKVAAAVIILLTSGIYFLYHAGDTKQAAVVQNNAGQYKNDVAPGGNKAVLTLADGSTVILDSASNGKVAEQGNAEINKVQDGQLVYKKGDSKQAAAGNQKNTIATPRGGYYQIVLPDGTKVCLNASSALTFPTAFADEQRVVELSGEAYFEVAESRSANGNKKIPFKVKLTDGTEVEVLGTHFNVMAYSNEHVVSTTLFEGRVKVSKGKQSRIILPGQQAKTDGFDQIEVIRDVDLDEVVAWKNGVFQFHNTDMQSIMRELERWYNIEVNEEGMPPKRFNGIISRNVPLSQVLKMMEITSSIRFKIDGRRVSMAN